MLSDEAQNALPGLMERLVRAPAWSSGGDIRTLVGETVRKQAAQWAEGRAVDINTISLDVLTRAVDAVIEKKEADNKGVRPERKDIIAEARRAVQSAMAQEAPPPHEHHHEHVPGIRAEFATQVEAAVGRLGLSPEEARAQMKSGDANSALACEIAKQTGASPKEVAEELQETLEATESQPESLGWVCMFCGNSNPDCPYKGRDDRERFNALTHGMAW
jgi:hypothetical protein